MSSQARCGVDQLSFPVLCLSRDTSITTAESPERLQGCNARALFTTRYFEDLIVFDSTGEQYRVLSAEMSPPLTGMRRWLARAFNRSLTVRLELQRENAVSLATAKQHVLIWLKKDPDFWEESRDIDDWERLVDAAKDMRRLIELFA